MLTKTEFKEIFNRYFDPVRTFIFYRCGDASVASDIAQDVFMKIWEKREQFESSSIKSLLYKIANDMVISNYRKEQSRFTFERSMVVADNQDFSPEEVMQYKEARRLYADALTGMTEEQRVTFLMNRNDGLTYTEIAGHLSISVKTVEKRMTNALRILKKKLL